MEIFKTTILNHENKKQLFDLWNYEYPEKLGFTQISDMENYLQTLTDLEYYLLKNENRVEGWALTFNNGLERWFAITIAGDVQRMGKGTFLLNKLKADNDSLNGWVIDHQKDRRRNGETYESPLSFYKKNGFKIFPECRLELPVLSAVKISWESP